MKYWFIVWKYVFLLNVLGKNENIINARYWVLCEYCKKIIPSKKNQTVLITKITSRKTQKNRQSAKIKLPQKFRATW